MSWRLVRRVDAANLLSHPADDQLQGTAVYGAVISQHDAPVTFTFVYSAAKYDEYLFTSGDLTHWLHIKKEYVFGDYDWELRPVLGSSLNPEPHQTAWRN